MRGDSPLWGGGSLGEAPLPETALNVCLCLPGERSLHFLTVAGAGTWGLRRWSLGWVRWQHRQVLLRSQAVDRMAFGASGREQSTTKVHLGSHPHPQRRLRKDPELLPRCRPSPVLSSATQSKKQVATPRGLHCAGCWLGVGPQLPHREGLGSPQPPPRPHHRTPPEWVFMLQSCHPFEWKILFLDRFLFGSLCSMSDFSGKDDRVSGLRDTVWLSTFSSRNLVVLSPGWLMRSGGGQAGRPFFLRNGAAATRPAVLTPRSRFLRHTYPISYPHPNKAH